MAAATPASIPDRKGAFSMPVSHAAPTLDQLGVVFDDTHAVASAGLLLPATLAGRLGIEQTADELIDLGDRAGAVPAARSPRCRHSNLIEGTFGETRRRVKVIGRLPGEQSCLSLVWAVLDRASRAGAGSP
jgi:hypothetical protein